MIIRKMIELLTEVQKNAEIRVSGYNGEPVTRIIPYKHGQILLETGTGKALTLSELLFQLKLFNEENRCFIPAGEYVEEVLFVTAFPNDNTQISVSSEADMDMAEEITVMFNHFMEDGIDELDAYMDMLESGIGVDIIRKYRGDEQASHMEHFCKEHGLLDEEVSEPSETAYAVRDKFVSIQTGTNGYDYSIFNADYSLHDGGVIDDPDIAIHEALSGILEDIGVYDISECTAIDYEELMERSETVEQEVIRLIKEGNHVRFNTSV